MGIFAFQFPSRCWRPPTPAAANAAPNAAVNAAPNAAANVAIVTRNREYCKFHNQVFSLFVLIFLTVKVLVIRQSHCVVPGIVRSLLYPLEYLHIYQLVKSYLVIEVKFN